MTSRERRYEFGTKKSFYKPHRFSHVGPGSLEHIPSFGHRNRERERERERENENTKVGEMI
jgi:hypothetical protein